MNESHKYIQNIRCYTAYRLFWGLLIIGPILMPYLLLKGLSYSEIMILQSVAAISVVLFEVPTGTIADKISRKLSIFLGAVCMGIALTVYVLADSFYALAIAEAIFGLGMTFGSGADTALLHESLDRMGRKDDYTRIEGRAIAVVFAGQGIGAIVSSILYTYNPNLPFWISVANMFIAALISLGFVETERQKSEHQYHIHVLRSVNIVFKTPRILWTVLLAVLMGFAFRSCFWLYEPFFKTVHIEVVWYGTIFFFFNVVAALSAKFLNHRFNSYRRVLLCLGIILAASYLLPALFVYPWAIGIIASQQIVRGMYRPTLNAYINRQIDDQYRATVISIVSLSANLSYACLAPLVGTSLDTWGAIPTYVWMGTVTLGGILLLGLLRKAQRLRQPIEIPSEEGLRLETGT
ncbi:MAG: MFS transporter [bacterium]|nr:MFS transporter [bacterium]